METLNRITARQEIRLGKPVVRGTRLTVELLLRKMSEGATAVDLPDLYPQLAMADIEAAMRTTLHGAAVGAASELGAASGAVGTHSS